MLNDLYYVMLDSPAIKVKVGGTRKVRQTNKPRRAHLTLEAAMAEASRLAGKTRYRAVVLRVVCTVENSPKEKDLTTI